MKYLVAILISLGTLWLACGGSDGGDAATENSSKETEEVVAAGPDGEKVYKTYCVACHGIDGAMGLNGALPIGESQLTVEERVALITNGRNLMTPFGGILKEEEIQAVAEYSLTIGQ